ncbi:MAG: lysylphosphatidylglycerol synthase transmembrane domain-containing protein [Candidatus Glassbacteria bacterium]
MDWKKWVGFVISFFFLGLVILNHNLRQLLEGLMEGNMERILNPELHLSEMRRVFGEVDFFPLFAATVVSLFLFVIRAVRWHYLFLPKARIGFGPLFSATMIGFMANNVLPARIGEFVRAYVISKKENISASSALATLAVERLFDAFCLLLIFISTFYLYTYPDWVRKVGVAATLVFFGFFIVLVLIVIMPDRFVSILSGWSRILPGKFHHRIEGILVSFVEGLDILKDKKLIFLVFWLSLLHWVLLGWGVDLGLRAFSIDVPPIGPYFVVSVVCIGIAIPSSPGFVGTFQWFMEKGLSVYNIPKDLSLPFSIGFHLVLYIPTTVVGLIYFFKENLTWGEVKRTVVGENKGD